MITIAKYGSYLEFFQKISDHGIIQLRILAAVGCELLTKFLLGK